MAPSYSIAATSSLLVAPSLPTGVSGLLLPARAQTHQPPQYRPVQHHQRPSIVDQISKGDYWMSGTVRRAGRAPLSGQHHPNLGARPGQEHEPQSLDHTLRQERCVPP
jgi:hypothetical protein